MKTRKKLKFRSRKNGAKCLPRLTGSRCPEFKISVIQMDDLYLTRIRASASSSEYL